MVGPKHNGRSDEAVLVTFDSSDHCCLGCGRLIVVYHSDPPEKLTEGVVSTFSAIEKGREI